jgi:hypothetical protein
MKITNREIVTNVNRLMALSEKPLPVKASYALAKNIVKIQNELKVYDKERARLIDLYAEKNEHGVKSDVNGQIIFKSDCAEKWNKDIADLLDIENEIDIHKFKLDVIEGYSMTPAEIMLIEYMIEE